MEDHTQDIGWDRTKAPWQQSIEGSLYKYSAYKKVGAKFSVDWNRKELLLDCVRSKAWRYGFTKCSDGMVSAWVNYCEHSILAKWKSMCDSIWIRWKVNYKFAEITRYVKFWVLINRNFHIIMKCPDGNFNGIRKCGAGFNYELKLPVSGLLGMRLEYKWEVNFYMHCN